MKQMHSFSLLLLLFILCAAPVDAQTKTGKLFGFFSKVKPDKLFDNRQYYAAAQAFEKDLTEAKAGSNTTEIRRKIGLCYLNINQPEKALFWLQQVAEGGFADGDTWYRYGLALQQTANYTEAITAFEECLQMQPGHPTASVKIESCRFAMLHKSTNKHFIFRPATEVNTAGGEFGASLYANNMVYYSSAAAPVEGAKIDQRTGLQFVQTWMMRMQNRRLVYPQIADNTLPKYISEEGLFAYDSIARCVYFTWCDPNNNRCGIYTSRFTGGKWNDPEIVYQNKKEQICGHPALANGGNRLYFTANFSDGVGETDIWYMNKTGNRWGQPVNAGNIINTFGREEFPFIYADTLLFFASDGHVGYGGLDIFCSVVKDNSFSPPVNLMRPFNSPGDDFNLIFNGNTGVLSSSRNELVSDDMYFFEGLPSFHYLDGYVADIVTGEPLNAARLTLSVDGVSVQQTVSDSTGYYGFFLHNDELPMIYARTLGYTPSLTDVHTFSTEQFATFRHDVRLQQSKVIPATIQLYHKVTGNPISERGIICFNNDGEVQYLRTDASGEFKLLMQEDQREYWIRFPDGAYLTENIVLNGEQKSYTLAVQPINEDLFTGWLQFKRGSMEATEMSQALIPHIASVIKANQGMTFVIEGFCEPGFEARQQDLPMQRAEYIVRRLVDEGVDRSQLSPLAAEQESVLAAEEESILRRVDIKIKR